MCKFGDLYYANLPMLPGSQVQNGVRPVLVVSNDKSNSYSPVISIVPLTGRCTKKLLPTHVPIQGHGLTKPSLILAEQIQSLDKNRLLGQIGSVNDGNTLNKIQNALMIQLNMIA